MGFLNLGYFIIEIWVAQMGKWRYVYWLGSPSLQVNTTWFPIGSVSWGLGVCSFKGQMDGEIFPSWKQHFLHDPNMACSRFVRECNRLKFFLSIRSTIFQNQSTINSPASNICFVGNFGNQTCTPPNPKYNHKETREPALLVGGKIATHLKNMLVTQVPSFSQRSG